MHHARDHVKKFGEFDHLRSLLVKQSSFLCSSGTFNDGARYSFLSGAFLNPEEARISNAYEYVMRMGQDKENSVIFYVTNFMRYNDIWAICFILHSDPGSNEETCKIKIYPSVGDHSIEHIDAFNKFFLAKSSFCEARDAKSGYDLLLEKFHYLQKSSLSVYKNDKLFVYMVRPSVYDLAFDGSLTCAFREELDFNELAIISTCFSGSLSHRLLCERNKSLINSAVGSIMSRNGSHNIGSHVLAALTHNVGTMPDDRLLYQYIQHRMDYIATVTTDFPPPWAGPAMFVGDIMKNFFAQFHLLEYIGKSEGLQAYRFQDQNHSATQRSGQKDTIRLHIQKKDHETGKIHRFIPYPLLPTGNPSDHIDPAQDVQLAIPGGVVGKHAIYTILENIIRNAAKHGWAAFPESRKEGGDNLDIHIEFMDNPENDGVEFTIWDNMSNVLREFRIQPDENIENCFSFMALAKLLRDEFQQDLVGHRPDGSDKGRIRLER